MRSIILLMLFVAGCRSDQLRQVTKCGHPCYVGDQQKAGVGACTMGTWLCDESNDESTATCFGQGEPSPEICDNIDNDCNGHVDYLTRDCSSACGPGYESCFEGFWERCTAPTPKPEVCNGKDDDCNGLFDDGIDEVVFCYDGNPAETAHGICRPGVKRCVLGVETCFGEVLPAPETCNGVDDNCNGLVDDGLGGSGPVDIVFVVDNSGSMGTSIAAVKLATTGFASTYGSQNIRWALVVAPGPDVDIEGVHLWQDFTDAGAFAVAMQGMAGTGSGNEPVLDAMANVTDSANPLHLSWSVGSRHVMVVFTDEEPQSYGTPQSTPMSVSMGIASSSTRTFVFTTTAWAIEWQWTLPTAWGSLRYLNNTASAMEMELKSLLEEVSCR